MQAAALAAVVAAATAEVVGAQSRAGSKHVKRRMLLRCYTVAASVFVDIFYW